MNHKAPGTSVAAPSRRSDAALFWFLLNFCSGLEPAVRNPFRPFKLTAQLAALSRKGNAIFMLLLQQKGKSCCKCKGVA